MRQMIMTETNFAVDTNVLIYPFDLKSSIKREKLLELWRKHPVVSSQVISEFINVSKRKLPFSKSEILQRCADVIKHCEIHTITIETLLLAKGIIEKHQLQIFDAIIVTSALQSNCSVLYPEDSQHKQVFENSLTIINPFL
jgi:predicted nucleic acid-binding protein